MKLISKIHDYYDPVMHQRRDGQVFVRELKKTFINDKCLCPLSKDSDGKFARYDFKFGIVGFCGKLYPYIETTVVGRDMSIIFRDLSYTWSHFCKKYPEVAEGRTRISDRYIFHLSDLQNWLNFGVYGTSRISIHADPFLNGLFKKENVAYFQVTDDFGGSALTLHPILRDLEFYKVFDLYEACQAIEMFLTNILAPRDNPYIAPIPDKIKAESHGFDKFSFRKDPTKKGK